MSDFEQRKPPKIKTRGSTLSSKAQTTRSAEEQREHVRKYKLVRVQRERELEKAAKSRCRALVLQMEAPIVGLGPFGQFPLAHAMSIEFARDLRQHLSSATLAKEHSSIHASAVQKFAALVKADKAFPSVKSLRLPDEPAVDDFVTLHLRVTFAAEHINSLLTFARQQERARHPHCAAVKALPADASLMNIVRAAALATKPKMGRPRKQSASEAEDEELSIAQNWVDGGYSTASMEKRTDFDARRINISQKETQADVLEVSSSSGQ